MGVLKFVIVEHYVWKTLFVSGRISFEPIYETEYEGIRTEVERNSGGIGAL